MSGQSIGEAIAMEMIPITGSSFLRMRVEAVVCSRHDLFRYAKSGHINLGRDRLSGLYIIRQPGISLKAAQQAILEIVEKEQRNGRFNESPPDMS